MNFTIKINLLIINPKRTNSVTIMKHIIYLIRKKLQNFIL